MEVSEYSLNSLISHKFEEYQQSAFQEMNQFFNKHREHNDGIFNTEREALQDKIEKQISEIDQLKAVIQQFKNAKLQSKMYAYLVCQTVNGKKLKKNAVDSWKQY